MDELFSLAPTRSALRARPLKAATFAPWILAAALPLLSFWAGACAAAPVKAGGGLPPLGSGGAQLPAAPGPKGSAGAAIAAPFRVSVKKLVVEGGSKPGDTVTVRLTIETSGGGTKAVPWTVYVDNAPLRADPGQTVAAGRTSEVSVTWRATGGRHEFHGAVDPNNTLGEPPPELGNNVSQRVTKLFSDWAKWGEQAQQAVQVGVSRWFQSARLTGVTVTGPLAVGGKLSGPALSSLMPPLMEAYGAPRAVAEGFKAAVSDAWQTWVDGVTGVPGLPWYPLFAAVPGPQAPPMANLPTPVVSTLVSSGLAALQPRALSASIRSRIGEAANWPGGALAIGEFCAWFDTKFASWYAGAMVANVLGQGPVPTWSLATPVGPVVGGSASSGNVSPLAGSTF